jgi:hypothetical protein
MLIPGGFAGWWKKYSAAALAAIVALQAAWAASPEVRELLDKETLSQVTAVLGVAGFVGRFISQTRKDVDDA